VDQKKKKRQDSPGKSTAAVPAWRAVHALTCTHTQTVVQHSAADARTSCRKRQQGGQRGRPALWHFKPAKTFAWRAVFAQPW
jgi:hypothetical protein